MCAHDVSKSKGKFSSRFEYAQKQLFLNSGVRPVLNSSTDNKGEGGENKPGTNISLYTVHVYK